jgi:hypothetical protein
MSRTLLFQTSGNQPGLRVPMRVRENILLNRLNLELALTLALTNIRLLIEVLAYQKQAQ